MSAESEFLKAVGAELLTPETAPGLYKAMEEAAEKLKIKMPRFHLLPEKAPSGTHGFVKLNFFEFPNAASLSREDIFVNRQMLKAYKSEDLTQPITAELQGMLAHEMHHSANRGSLKVMARLPVAALPAVAVTGTYIYDKAHEKAKNEGDISPQNILKHVDAATSEVADGMPSVYTNTRAGKSELNLGKYIAVAVAGLGAGLLAARYGSRYHEFGADLFGSKIAGKEAMTNALTIMHKEMEEAVSRLTHGKKVSKVVNDIMSSMRMMAHPDLAERVSHIRTH